ncbi:MAG: hypothetical protein K0B16_18020 [Burkholderiaceae bacterium]|nr:hypothetical protein [Burkholderiaceae bacterium]
MAENQIAGALSAARVELNDLQRKSVLLAGTLNDPDDPAWAEVDQGITEATAKIRRLTAMQSAGKVYAAEAAVAALQDRRQAAFGKAMEIARERVALASKIDKAIAAVGTLLDEWDATSAECHRHAAFLHSSDAQPGWQEAMLGAARGNSYRFSVALHWALFRAGIGRKCIYLEQDLHRRQIGDPSSLTDAATYVVGQLDVLLQRSLETLKVQ